MGNVKLMNNSETIATVTIPVWKNGLANAIALYNQKKVLEQHQTITKHTNDLIKKNAKTMRKQMKLISEETQKNVVGLDTLASSTNDIIGMLIETAQENENGRIQRRNVEQKLIELNQKITTIPLHGSIDELNSWKSNNVD